MNEKEHEIKGTEAVWLKVNFELKDGMLTLTKSKVEESVMGLEDRKEYNCKCGKTFKDIRKAEDHIKEARGKN